MPHDQRITIVSETGFGKYQNKITIGEHHFLASEPIELGGDDSGPTPVEILNAALGACTAITLRMYADRKGWPLQHVSVKVTHKRGVVEECDEIDIGQSLQSQEVFTKDITFTGPLGPEQIERLLAIAKKCPVHKMLQHQACMRTRLSS